MTPIVTVKSCLSSAVTRLASDEAVLESQLLLQHVLGVSRAWLIAHENDALQPNIHAVFEALLQRRLNGEPITYILGYREFYGLKLKVTPATLIPRPDTETLVEAALEKLSRNHAYKVLDLGTGSGAIALAIAKHRPETQVAAVDASVSALQVAIENSQTLNIHNVRFVQSDWFSALGNEKFDVIVSNPPYIEDVDPHLNQGDLRFEPRSALASGNDGLDDIRRIVKHAPAHLTAGGWLMLEHGYNQAEMVADLLRDDFCEIHHALDLAGIQRVTLGKLK
jgi:release factor glutamine methyltransferase